MNNNFFPIVIALLMVFTVGFGLNLFIFHISPPQPTPTSDLITTQIKVRDISFTMYPGENTLIVDSYTGRGYYYHRWFEFPVSFIQSREYTVQYYCDNGGNRQIYSYVDTSSQIVSNTGPKPADAKCITINGVCQ
jgi:hypothetical protein